ncbi:MAG TPA: hypothetical protein VJO35_08105 [Terriglobales bacterium]|nr:hypothetical protein [Terriglobales bacterium]
MPLVKYKNKIDFMTAGKLPSICWDDSGQDRVACICCNPNVLPLENDSTGFLDGLRNYYPLRAKRFTSLAKIHS